MRDNHSIPQSSDSHTNIQISELANEQREREHFNYILYVTDPSPHWSIQSLNIPRTIKDLWSTAHAHITHFSHTVFWLLFPDQDS